MKLEVIAEELENQAIGQMGKTIFINHMPDNCLEGVLLRMDFTGTPIDYYLPNYRKTEFWLITRSKEYGKAKTLAENAAAAISYPHGGVMLSDLKINYLRPQTEPVHFPVTAGGYHEFLVIFDANYVIVA